MSEETFHGIPRKEITWYPIINYQKCTSCGKCIDYCHTKAFGKSEDKEKKTIVRDLNACVVLCRGCEDICPVGAITHPPEDETHQLIRRLRREKFKFVEKKKTA